MNGGESQNDLVIKIEKKKMNDDLFYDLEKRRLEIISNVVIRICKEKICEL